MYASSLWTLQHLCFGPDVAADYSDRGENRDPGRRQKSIDKGEAIRERPSMASTFLALRTNWVGCGHMSGLCARLLWPLALMISAD